MTMQKVLTLIVAVMMSAEAVDVGGQKAASDTSQSAFLFLRSIPEGATVVINNDTVVYLMTKPIQVPAGAVRVLVSAGDKELYSRPLPFQPDEKKIINIGNNPTRALLDIISEPVGADVLKDGTKIGVTPFLDSLLEPGLYKLEVKKAGYDPYMKIILLTPQEELELSLDLKHSQTWIDSVAHEKILRRQKHRFLARVACGALCIAFGGVSGYFDLAAHNNLKNADAAAGMYEAANEGFLSHKDAYYRNRDLAKRDIQKRNMLAAISAGAALGFALTFAF